MKGTDANVLITIYGENGDTGKQILDGPGNNFERNQVDEFGIEAVDLGSLQKIRIGKNIFLFFYLHFFLKKKP